ncbi:hypothetical protein DW664_10360 [Lachnospiraceae bacterium AM25-11LB]|nr:hypothetical protein DW675_09020 [Lachnospiraceae bacterium AM25-22]RGD07877.1 hypothetical protein DW664_10360 [Lachnospiraceae bacterium AM25-11LB]RJW11899.1 hypothetical protein DW685_09005 [Lachnospiraceae bacterium AM25-40]RJW15613.1 hypothetical protein DW684_08730 [Lachnospiraceae bacterium AM25-39]
MLIFVMTENRVEKARFYHDISQCEKIVCELEENVLQINKEGIVEDTDMGQNMSISGPIRIIQWDEKQYVWFYTSSLLSGESTGYFHQIDISQQNKDTIYEVNLFMQTSYIQREPSDVFQTLQQSSAEVSKEKIAHGMKETDPGVFASVLTESLQKSIDKNSYGDPVTVTVKVEKNHSRTYELSETERSKLETAMFPTE